MKRVDVPVEVGQHLAVWEVGEGPPVVFLHGSGPGASGPSNFGRNALALAAAGYRAVLIDSLGYGDSSKPVDGAYTLDRMAGAALEAVHALGIDRATWVGNSQGGAQALWIALNAPERVEKLVLMAPGGMEAREVYMGLRGIRAMMKSLYSPPGDDPQGPGSLTKEGLAIVLSRQVFDPSILRPEVIEERWVAARQQPLHVFQTMMVPDLSERLGELSMPVLGLWGMDDVFCPPSGALKIAERVPHARVTLFTRCGHWVMVEHEGAFNRALLDFLAHG